MNATNFSDPVVWAAKLAYENFVAAFGPDGARMIAVYQRVRADLNANPERGTLARRLTQAKRFFRGIWRVITCPLHLEQLFYKGSMRHALVHRWRGREFLHLGHEPTLDRDWDIERDARLAELGGIERRLAKAGVNIDTVITHKMRLDSAVATAPKKPPVNYGIRMEGFNAARDHGKRLADNPYSPGTTEHHSWAKGWKQGVPAGRA